MTSTSRRFLVLVAVAAMAAGCDDDKATEPEGPPAMCGTIQGLTCPAGQTCELPAGQCEVADLGGVCVPTPEFCTQEYEPVCGCDGVTYSNECERLRIRVQKRHDGACPG